MASALRIGELASAAGVSTDAVRYYERLKILPRPSRARSGYRLYFEEDIERLRFIKQAQSLGLSLDEVKELLPGRGAGLSECPRVRDLLSAKLAELDAKISEMRAFRKTLGSYLEECEEALAGKRGDCCPCCSRLLAQLLISRRRIALVVSAASGLREESIMKDRVVLGVCRNKPERARNVLGLC